MNVGAVRAALAARQPRPLRPGRGAAGPRDGGARHRLGRGRAALPRAAVAALRSAGARGDAAAQPAARRRPSTRWRRRRWRSRTRPGRSAARRPRGRCSGPSRSDPQSDGPGRARVFVRFGIIDTNPDGQAALFAQACVADPSLCDRERLKKAARREVQARFVPPGNVVPLYFGGHPRSAGWRAEVTAGGADPAGRVHLALQRDPASGEESVALAAPVFEEAWQNDVAAAAANSPRHPRWRATGGAVALARNAMAPSAWLMACWRARPPGGGVAAGGLRPLLLPERRRPPEAGDLRPSVADTVGRRLWARRGARRRRPRADARAVDRRSRPTTLRLPGRGRAVHDLRGPAARLPRHELARRRGVREAAARSGGARGVPGERPGRPFVHGADPRVPRGQRRPSARRR